MEKSILLLIFYIGSLISHDARQIAIAQKSIKRKDGKFLLHVHQHRPPLRLLRTLSHFLLITINLLFQCSKIKEQKKF